MAEPDQSDFFGAASASRAPDATPTSPAAHQPLAARMRPQSLAEIVGQEQLTRAGSLLPQLITTDRFGSLLFYGPPGCGKTSFAEVIARETKSRFVRINAVMSNVAELREILSIARKMPEARTLLFIDELHRFNKAQQDLLLPDVEEGNVRLIGATTHNPGFYVNPPLLSRSHLFRLEPLSTEAVATVLRRALEDGVRGLGEHGLSADDAVLTDLAVLCDGDLRRALNALEVIALSLDGKTAIEATELESFARERRIRYDANEDEHYDTISAFIKSCRGGDPDAAMYWLAKMLGGGEDPRFIARRLVILASEDIGLADPFALPLAVAAHHACEFVGLPEAELTLAHATLHIACAPKSNSATMALAAAKQALKSAPVQPVPTTLRDKGGKASKRVGHGKGYEYSHDFPEGISGQNYLEQPLKLYEPSSHGLEARIADRLARWDALRAERRAERDES
ncbi:replication-associated recombination protein A [Synoicihabitans lomoniglobus]|uniref:Replication-associated recombination protein A n=1 Tax=Synoicihabitans lomoniglobus TaxID=2909285 RepID=A0AAE9ZVP2_9BACT|nr:replication-associated recombination protein A [Opitutaceae bacterium LMO-M01]WED64962.1 replication-associated recombination protein A [Opitutaceae bacterium LMO-M01]